jgi:hypothetical protein
MSLADSYGALLRITVVLWTKIDSFNIETLTAPILHMSGLVSQVALKVKSASSQRTFEEYLSARSIYCSSHIGDFVVSCAHFGDVSANPFS